MSLPNLACCGVQDTRQWLDWAPRTGPCDLMQKLLCLGLSFWVRIPFQGWGKRPWGFGGGLFQRIVLGLDHFFPVVRSSWSTYTSAKLKSSVRVLYSLPKQRLYCGKDSMNAFRSCLWKSEDAAHHLSVKCPTEAAASPSASIQLEMCSWLRESVMLSCWVFGPATCHLWQLCEKLPVLQ